MDREKVEPQVESESRKRLVANCQLAIRDFFDTKQWEIFQHKFKLMNYTPPEDLFQCKVCDDPLEGHFDPESKRILLCSNNIPEGAYGPSLVHELVHLYDDVRADFDYKDPDQVACGEIRAIHISGECKKSKKWFRRRSKTREYMTCVHDRALSTLKYATGLDAEAAEEVITNVWDVCYYDLDPFNFEQIKKMLANKPL